MRKRFAAKSSKPVHPIAHDVFISSTAKNVVIDYAGLASFARTVLGLSTLDCSTLSIVRPIETLK
jgi:hypothetical protein